MLANYHTHTTRCFHAEGSDREYIESAIMHGMKVLGFADHCPWIYPDGYVSGIRMSPDMVDDYFSSLTSLRQEYADDIKIYIGFEAEYIPELIEEQYKFLSDYPVDYMILGQHSYLPENKGEYLGRPVKDESILAAYVDSVIEGMKTGKYKYVAHPDLLNFTGSDDIYIKHFTRLCEYLKSENIPVEINLLGLANNRHYPSDRFFRIAQKTGNTAIIGCDAHFPDMLSNEYNIKKCENFAEKYQLELVDYIKGLEP